MPAHRPKTTLGSFATVNEKDFRDCRFRRAWNPLFGSMFSPMLSIALCSSAFQNLTTFYSVQAIMLRDFDKVRHTSTRLSAFQLLPVNPGLPHARFAHQNQIFIPALQQDLG